MAKNEEKGVSIEVLGTCMTNTTPDSQHDAKVEYRHLWSYAQQAALIAVSDKNPADGCYHLITDPERRAKRIAGHYAFLYFESARKSNRKLQFYWPALAAFVVKDIVEAYRFAREEVLHREWKDVASAFRNSTVADLGSVMMTNDSPYQHALRTYSALAKGNLWLFMDIYPWLWFFLEYGINPDGSLNQNRLGACLPERNWSTFQKASKEAIEELPFGPNGWVAWRTSWKTMLSTRKLASVSTSLQLGRVQPDMASMRPWRIGHMCIAGRMLMKTTTVIERRSAGIGESSKRRIT